MISPIDFTRFKNIEAFYQETGMDRYQAFEFLKKQFEKTI